MPKRTDIKKILVIGSGPIVIGQACEFDYSGTQACESLKALGYEVVLVNSNPATIMTDPGIADRTYVEPITADSVAKVIERERPDALLPNMGGQTGLNCAIELDEAGVLSKYGVEVIGCNTESIRIGEDRKLFAEAMEDIGLHICRSGFAYSVADAERIVGELGFPVIIRPSFTLGGAGGGIAYDMDDLRRIALHGKDYLARIQQRESETTGIPSLKISFNNVFGYYIEIRKGSLDAIKPEFGYVRKQTLANAERFITDELKEKEELILHAQEEKIRLEAELFADLLNQIKVYLPKLHDLAQALATIDVLYALAVLAADHGYVRPQFHDGHAIDIVEGRHPILDSMMKKKRYVSNNLHMDERQTISIITGPNMGGKSTYMRQNALLVIMAQIGSFVPARKADLPIFDQIFTRIGASDDILSGKSTFMVEMMEANHALQHATDRSLILFDEIGRGTSTYDGMALAQAMIEYINENIHAKTLFSTHYHELTQLGEHSEEIRNIHVDVHEEDDHVTFLYRVVDGKADKSYGINVARLAKLPEVILQRAGQLLDALEREENHGVYQPQMLVVEKDDPKQKEIMEMIDMIDINSMTPMEAMSFLYELKKKRTA